MDFLKNLAEETTIVFFTTLAAGLATLLIGKVKNGHKKNHPAPTKRKKGGRPNK